MTRIALVLLLCLPACMELGWPTAEAPPGGNDPFRADPFFLDRLLEWEGDRYQTLGPTGDRLFADRLLPEPGFRGRFGYLHATDALPELFRYEFIAPGGEAPVEDFSQVWRPSHQENRFRLHGVDVVERKFITEDDVAVSLLTFDNQGDQDQSFGVRVRSQFAQRAGFRAGGMRPVDLSILANHPVPDTLQDRLKPGLLEVGGVPFLVIDPQQNGGRAVLGLRDGSGQAATRSLPPSLEIPVNLRARRLHFLGQIGRSSGPIEPGAVVARYQIYYEEGMPVTRELRYGENVADLGDLGSLGTGQGGSALESVRGTDGLFSYSIPVNSRRSVRFVRFETRDQPFAPMLLALSVESAQARDSANSLVGQGTLFGQPVASSLAGEVIEPSRGRSPLRIRSFNRKQMRLEGAFLVPSGGQVTLKVAHAFGSDAVRAADRASAIFTQPDPLRAHQTRYHSWYDRNCPRFLSGDPYLDKLWWYRWFVVRHNLARPASGSLPDTVFFEGRHGDWYPRLISFASPHIIAETRWLKDGRYAKNQVLAHLASAAEDGLLQSARVDWQGGYYNHWIARAALELEQVHPDREFLERIAPALLRDVLATLERFDPDGDRLPAAPTIFATGMEYQPAFFHFEEYDNTKPPARLERPDFAAYLYGNAKAVEQIYRRLARPDEAGRMADLAGEIRSAALEKLWSPLDGLFYSVNEQDDRPAICPEIVAFYPFATGLAPDDFSYTASFQHLLSAAEFRTEVPFASCSQQVPVFSAALETWPGKGGHVEHRMWNGPVWPHANSVIANALGEVLLHYQNHDLRPDDLGDFLRQYARLQFERGDLARPMIRETADAETGEQWGCPDYFHSTWIDLVFRYHELLGWPAPEMPEATDPLE